MKNYLGIGISIGVLAGLWTQASIELELITWVAFTSWAIYFATGGKRDGFTKGLAANLSGVVWAWVVSQVIAHATFNGALAISVAVLGLVLCLQASLPLLSFIPGAFVGAAVFFGTAFDFWGTVLALVIGACLGWASDLLGARIQSALSRPAATPDVTAPVQPA